MLTSLIKEYSHINDKELSSSYNYWFIDSIPLTKNSDRKIEAKNQIDTEITTSFIKRNALKQPIQPTPLELLHAEILSYMDLPDFKHSKVNKPSENMLKFAIQLLNYLPSGVPIPRPMISEEGEIGFYWDYPTAFADLEIEENGYFSVFTKIKKTPPLENFTEDLSFSPSLQLHLKDALKIFLRE